MKTAKYLKLSLILFVAFLLSACATSSKNPELYRLSSTTYQQRAAEYYALCLQVYSAAQVQLDRALKKKGPKPPAIVVDVDETVLDNSPFQARAILDGLQFNYESWDAWILEQKAEPVPGSLPFLKYAAQQGVAVFYVTNRHHRTFEATFQNLKRLGYPIKRQHLMLRKTSSSKKARRARIKKDYHIVLMVGDNLTDFSADFESHDHFERRKRVDQSSSLLGKKYFLLPNAVYGDWEKAILKSEKSSPTHAHLKALSPKR